MKVYDYHGPQLSIAATVSHSLSTVMQYTKWHENFNTFAFITYTSISLSRKRSCNVIKLFFHDLCSTQVSMKFQLLQKTFVKLNGIPFFS